MNDVWRARPEQPLELEPRVLGEDLPVRPEAHVGAGLALRHPLALAGQARLGRELGIRALAGEDAGYAAVEAQPLLAGRPVDVDVHPRRQRVDDREPDAVEAARGDVRAAAELAAGVQLGRHDLDAREPGLGLLVGRDAAPVVEDLDGVVGVQGDLDPVGGARQRLVDPVVDDLPEAVHQPARVGGPDVHAGPFADRLEALEDQQVCGVVGVVDDRGAPAESLMRVGVPNLPATRRGPMQARLPGARHDVDTIGARSGRSATLSRTTASDSRHRKVQHHRTPQLHQSLLRASQHAKPGDGEGHRMIGWTCHSTPGYGNLGIPL